MNGSFFATSAAHKTPRSLSFVVAVARLRTRRQARSRQLRHALLGYSACISGGGAGGGNWLRGFWIRVLAAIIDAVLLRVVVAPIHLFFGGLGLAGMMSGVPHARMGLGLLGGGVTLIALFFGGWLYEALMESSSYQATLGKMVCGMKVTDLYGNRISFGRATGRHFAKILSAMLLGVGYIMVAFTERKQGLHDLLAGTLVRRG